MENKWVANAQCKTVNASQFSVIAKLVLLYILLACSEKLNEKIAMIMKL